MNDYEFIQYNIQKKFANYKKPFMIDFQEDSEKSTIITFLIQVAILTYIFLPLYIVNNLKFKRCFIMMASGDISINSIKY